MKGHEFDYNWTGNKPSFNLPEKPEKIEFMYLASTQDIYYPTYAPSPFRFQEENRIFQEYFMDKLIGGRNYYFAKNAVLKIKIDQFSIEAEEDKGFLACTLYKYSIVEVFPLKQTTNIALLSKEASQNDCSESYDSPNSNKFSVFFKKPNEFLLTPNKPKTALESALLTSAKSLLDCDVADAQMLDYFRSSEDIRFSLKISDDGKLEVNFPSYVPKFERSMLTGSVVSSLASGLIHRY